MGGSNFPQVANFTGRDFKCSQLEFGRRQTEVGIWTKVFIREQRARGSEHGDWGLGQGAKGKQRMRHSEVGNTDGVLHKA